MSQSIIIPSYVRSFADSWHGARWKILNKFATNDTLDTLTRQDCTDAIEEIQWLPVYPQTQRVIAWLRFAEKTF